LLQELLPYVVGRGNLVADYFAGSGTTVHALLQLNQTTKLGLRWLVVESGPNFAEIILPRIKKAAFSTEWLKGKPVGTKGPGVFFRAQVFEQYEDTLENLEIDPVHGESIELLFDNPALALRYRLRQVSREIYCGIEHFKTPFGYELKRASAGEETLPSEVDLVETLPYLLGMAVSRLYREPQGVVLLGQDRRGRSLAIFFRDGINVETTTWLIAKLDQHPADRVFTNDPASLNFEGSDRLEAIEAIFAMQFGRE
jgi:adenine-specific DNA-methyltransferase